jgi:hypothetical protein
MKALLSALLVAGLLAGCAGGLDLPEGSGEVRIKHRIPSK